MKIVSIELKNYKIHKDFKFDFNGKSAMLIGDKAVGKSTLINFILQYLGLKDFDTKSLSEGEESGSGALKVEVGGNEYTITRPLVGPDKKSRFKITSNAGSFDSMEAFYKAVMGGLFTERYFNYNEYFFQLKSPAARVKYFADVIGDPRIEANKDFIKNLKEGRKLVGSQRDFQEVIKKQSGLDELDSDTLQANSIYYKNARDIAEAKEVKEVFLKNNLIDIKQLEFEKQHVQRDSELLINHSKQIYDNNIRIEELKAELAALEENNALVKHAFDMIDPTSTEKLEVINQQLESADSKNNAFKEKADDLYEDEIKVITDFNEKRSAFIRGIQSFKEFKRLDTIYNEQSDLIKEKEIENKKIFKESLPIPEISYEMNEDGSELIMYNGREFNFDNLSGGESIQIATKIQRALNPDKSNFILIQNAGLLGSGIDEILKEAKKFKTQVIMEVTERDEPLSIEFVEDSPKTILSRKSKATKANSVKK